MRPQWSPVFATGVTTNFAELVVEAVQAAMEPGLRDRGHANVTRCPSRDPAAAMEPGLRDRGHGRR